MDPIRLQKQLRDNNNDFLESFKDIKKWGEEMKRKEEILKNSEVDCEISVPRNKVAKIKKKEDNKDEKLDKSIKGKEKSKVPRDYNFWNKFDAEAECEKIDKEKNEDSDSDLTDEFDEAMIDLAVIEKEKGNKFVKCGRYEDAIKSYSNAIENYAYDPIFYANRALCHLKLFHYQSADADCTIALQIDKNYVKALYRRAIAREALKQYKEAESDLYRVLEIESDNKESKVLLEKIQEKLSSSSENKQDVSAQRPISKFTLSRQKQKLEQSVEKIVETKVAPDAISDKVIEHKKPVQSSKIVELIETKPSTSKEMKKLQSSKPLIETKKEDINFPLGANVEIIDLINKGPKERSSARLKRIQIFDTDMKVVINKPNMEQKNILSKKLDTLESNAKIIINKKSEILNTSPTDVNEEENRLEHLNFDVKLISYNIPIPTTSIQFYNNWKAFKDSEKRYQYLRQINPPTFTMIFKDTMDSNIFSEILQILSDVFISKNEPVFEYLYGLTKVKRFSTLVMFKNGNDKKALLKLADFMRTRASRTKEEVDYLIKKYEM